MWGSGIRIGKGRGVDVCGVKAGSGDICIWGMDVGYHILSCLYTMVFRLSDGSVHLVRREAASDCDGGG